MKINVQIKDIAGLLGCLYIFLSTNPFILWTLMPSVFYLLLILLIYPVSYMLGQLGELKYTQDRVALFFILAAFVLFSFLPINGRGFYWARILLFIPMFNIIFYSSDVYLKIFQIFKKLMIIISVFSILIFTLLLIGVNPESIPHYKVEGFTIPMLRKNDYYRIFGFIVSSTNTIYEFGGVTFARACGAFLEPGHFAIYLGITMSIDKLINNKINVLLLIAGFITFSPAFLIIFLLIIVYDIVIKRKFKLLIYISVVMLIILFVIVKDEVLREKLYYLAIERTIVDGIKETLDERTSKKAYYAYHNLMTAKDLVFGKGFKYVEDLGVLSDVRGFLIKYGFIGLILSILINMTIFLRGKFRSIFLFVPIIILIFLHRSWMYGSPYIYLLVFIGINIYHSGNANEIELSESSTE